MPVRQGPPYAPPSSAGLGLTPTVPVDVPVSAILMTIYLGFAAWNIKTFFTNKKKGHKFLISWFLGVFSMMRVATCALRIAWAVHPHNIRLVIAAQIFTNAGILIVFLININFGQRLLRSVHPRLGWHPVLHWGPIAIYATIGLTFIMVIVTIILRFYTLDEYTLSICADCQKVATVILFAISALALVMVTAIVLLPRSGGGEQPFGTGSLQAKIVILAVSASLATLIAGFKCGVNFMPPRPVDDAPWYDLKPTYYCLLFVTEIMILALFAVTRIDQRFHVPNGSGKVKSYAFKVEG
ncbi:hypothetical protein BDZ85DRAFT_249960 [Elsinoe ampelina]|uniref:Integral membrane protein n=1 Tax=Elsinoe ampelina TaxID=302913 RepID=A0A6A6GBS4_9PEZI|nr:hypothetical protein BDZ85DRAFT_249960 [Elsinoe ampelina]